ncbi:AMP-binding protein [Azospirillum soli]|uniref:AMP-binding protein n=1 Tax=Azospirillum soli TaxID=1304799 RepID=UPI001AE27189|nr:AMP-binding protein [Azospirillum soli]
MTDNLYSLLLKPGSSSDARVALRTDTGQTWTYADLWRTAGRMARFLHEAGVGPGDRVAVQVAKSPEAVCLYLATLQLGAIYLPLNTAYTLTELRYFVDDAEPTVFVGQTPVVGDLVPPAGCATFTLDPDGEGSVTAACRDLPPWEQVAEVGPDEVAAILYTSGTTGRPKGAMISHGNLAYGTRTLNALWGISDADVLLHALPMFHAHGLFIALNSVLYAGASCLFLPRFTADAVIEHLPRSTVFMGVPTLYTRLLADARLDRERCGSMRLFTCGSAPLSRDVFEVFEARTGHRILERYGMTETTIIASNPLDGERLPGTVGYPLPGLEVRIVDDAGRPTSEGEVGGLELRGPNVFKGYWRMPEKTAAEFRPDGFFMTGDMAHAAPDGRLTLVSRAKEIIISGGYNVYPREVEIVLNRVEGVSEAAVFGVPHPDFGEGVVAVVERQPGCESLDPASILAQASRELAGYKLPKAVIVQDALPRNAMGKVLKNELGALHKDVFRKQGASH